MEWLEYWPGLAIAAWIVLSILASVHAIFYKRDPRAALAWIVTILMVPFIGVAAYSMFGINRIQRRARRLKRRPRRPQPPVDPSGDLPAPTLPPLSAEAAHLATLAELSETVTDLPLLKGNTIEPLCDGDQAYPAMLRAIDEAQASIGLCMYIFSNDAVGMMFVEALERAAQRGVEVRVLIDDIGAHFTWNSILGPLLAAKIRTARFLPRWILRTAAYANLRNHRKILVVDGRIGFAGGMNIADGYWVGRTPASAIRDLQFRIQGPVVAQMQATFADDWKFTTGENLAGTRWYPTPVDNGGMLARGVSSGPDEDFDKIRLVILGALASARSAVRIVTPYFLPDPGLISALTIAALRGVQVDILIPKESDLRLVQWASMAQLPQVLEYGCRVWITQPPFLHTKLMIVDGAWVMLGSANWDPRSLRLNFEFNIECYDRALAATLDGAIEKELQSAERITLKAWRSRPALVQLRDGIAWLMSPLL